MRDVNSGHPGRRAAVAAVVAAGLAAAACGGGEARAGDAGDDAARADRPEAASLEAGDLPSGWMVRTDRGETSPRAVDFASVQGGHRVRPGPRAIYWNPEMRATGLYRVRAELHRLNDPGPEAYGLFVGGRDLRTEGQDYLYFLVRRDGSYLVKHRAGTDTHTLVDWTEHSAVRGSDGEGGVSNTLAVESRPDAVRFLVNGTEVERLERAPMLNTDGEVGVRVNHRLDVRIEGLRVEPLEGAGSGEGPPAEGS